MGRQRGKLGLTRAQSKSTASSISSWCPILDTPKSSSSWWVIRSSWSPPTFSFSKVLMYCCRQSSRPEGKATGRQENFQHSTTRWTISSLAVAGFFLISWETYICIMFSNRAPNQCPCQNQCWKSLKAWTQCVCGCVLWNNWCQTGTLTDSSSSTIPRCVFSFQLEKDFS